MIFAINVVLAT